MLRFGQCVFVNPNEQSGNLEYSRGFDNGGAPLPFREFRSFFLVSVDAAEGFSVRIINGYQIMVVPPAPVFSKLRFSIAHSFARRFIL